MSEAGARRRLAAARLRIRDIRIEYPSLGCAAARHMAKMLAMLQARPRDEGKRTS